MSRIGKKPVAVPQGVTASVEGQRVKVKGPKGALEVVLHDDITPRMEADSIIVAPRAETKRARAMWGLSRSLVNNLVTGVTKGFERKLALVGVGFRAQAQGDKLNLSLGYSHPVVHQMPKGVKVVTPTQTEIVITGVDKQLVGQVAAEVRAYRPPEPYKGKGVRYLNEVIVLKETKKK